MAEEQKAEALQLPEAKDKITREDGDKLVALVKLDMEQLALERAKACLTVAKYDYAIAERKRTLADIERRVVGVDFPEEPKKPEAPAAGTPQMGEPTGGTAKKGE